MNKKIVSRARIINYLFLVAILSISVFFYRIHIAKDFSLENNPYTETETPYCDVADSTLLIFSPDVPSLYYYSHGLAFILSLVVGFLLLRAQKGSNRSRLFLAMMILFCLWLVLDLIQWATADPVLMLYLWGVAVVLEVLFFGIALFIAKQSSEASEIPSWMIRSVSFLAGAVMLFIPSTFGLIGVDMETCEVIEGVMSKYLVYIYEFLCLLFIIHLAFKSRKNAPPKEGSGNTLFLLSIVLFLVLFFAGNLYGSLSENWIPSQYGLIGMPIFVLVLSYLIQKYDFSSAKVLLAQFLVLALLCFTVATLFVRKIENVRIVVIFTALFVVVLGYSLIKSVKKEIAQREQLTKLNQDLQESIKQRESLVHLVTHKVKGSFTRTKFIFAGILDGTFGKITPEIKKIAEQGMEFDQGGLETVDLVLNVANLEKGIIKYDMKVVNFRELLEKTLSEKRGAIEAKGLKLEANIADGKYDVTGDAIWLKEVIHNLLENSTKYTRQGAISVNLENKGEKLLLTVKDTGVGISAEDEKNLFTEGGRGKESIKINVDSTGYGLYSVKLIIDAHKGRVWEHSEGINKGSQFYVELPVV
ncbi:MAG: HAMP domain-containing sensor histidine kinase [Candidatus Paceibacterota bacterium]|jgi:signal transduction histidine kinase